MSFLSPEPTKLSIVNLTYFKCISFFVLTHFSLSTGFRSLAKSRCLTHLSTSTLFWKNVFELIKSCEKINSVVSWYLLVFKFTGEPKSGLHSFFILIRLYNSGVSNVAAKKKLGKIVLRIFAFKFSNSCLHMKK